MPTVLNEYVGDGVSKAFNISMGGGYLSRDYVKFYVRPEEALLDWTPLTNNTVTWTGDFSFTLAEAIPTGSVLVVFRETPLTPLVDFQNTSRITEKNLDTGITQPLHKVAELTDLVDRSSLIALSAVADSADALARVANSEAAALEAAEAALEARNFAEQAEGKATSADAFAQAADVRASQAAASAAVAEGNALAAINTADSAYSVASSAALDAAQALSTANLALSTAEATTAVAASALTTANEAAADAAQALTASSSAVATAAEAENTAAEALDLISDVVAGQVQSWNGRTGFVLPQAGDYTKDMVGLANVDNTADADKPLSTAMIEALDLKANATEVAQAIATTTTYSTVPVTKVADYIIVSSPHVRMMVWSSAQGRYIRAPWHAPGQLSYFLRDVPAGYVEVRSDVVLNRADFPDLAEYLGVTGATFVLDEARGEFLRSLDSGRGKDAGRVVGSHQGDAGRNLTGQTYSTYNGLSTGGQMATFASGALKELVSGNGASGMSGEYAVQGASRGLRLDASLQWPIANEFRPTNLAYRLAVQY